MNLSYLSQKIHTKNGNLPARIEAAFQKPIHISSKLIGERRIKSRLGSRVSFFPSIKNEGLICLESSLELAHTLGLERSVDVLEYRTQAVEIYISDQHFIIPDFIVKTTSGYEVHEIKSNIKKLSPKQLLRFNIAKEILNKYSIKFNVYDEKNLISRDECIFLNISYQKANHLKFTTYELNKAQEIFNTNKFRSKDDLYRILELNEMKLFIADYFIFYNKILGV